MRPLVAERSTNRPIANSPNHSMSAEAFLLDLPRFADAGAAAYRPGFERIEALLAAMEHPERAFPAVHIAGTNGKGSTASMVAALATAAGRQVGLHTSPHLLTVRERMRIDGVPAPADWLDAAVARYRDAIEATRPSFFEATLALSLRYFAERAVELAVIEVGLGGRLDATNVVRPVVSAVTHVGLDHTDLLGATREAIAVEKAGIARAGVPLVSAADGEAVERAITDEAARRGAALVRLDDAVRIEGDGDRLALETPVRRYPALRLDLPGAHQARNAALAVRLAEIALGADARPEALPPEAVARGLADTRKLSGLRARCEAVAADPLILVDVAHNADGVAAALATADRLAGRPAHVALGLMGDKDAQAVAALLAGRSVWPLALDGERALSREALAEALRSAEATVQPGDRLAEAVRAFRERAAPEDALLVTGSHLAAAEALAWRGAEPDADLSVATPT